MSELPVLHPLLIASYIGGLAAEEFDVPQSVVRLGMDAGLVMRSAFTAIPFERLAEPLSSQFEESTQFEGYLLNRMRLTRYLVDLGLKLDPAPLSEKPNREPRSAL